MKFVSVGTAIFCWVICANVYAATPNAQTSLDHSSAAGFYAEDEDIVIEPALGVALLGDAHPHTVPYASAVNPEYLADGSGQERIYDGLLPGDGFTITMDSFPDQNGSTECVQLIKSLMAAPRTIFGKKAAS